MRRWLGASAADAPATRLPRPPTGRLPRAPSGAGQGRQAPARYTIPSDTDIARQPNAEQINYGKRLLNETRRLLPNNTGASMNCNSCHVQQGKPMGAPYINTVNSFPQFNPRANRVVTLEDRINGCFMRSMNGKPLAKDSAEMQAMIAYMKWLAQDVPHGAKVQIENAWPIDMKLTPNPERGKSLYAAQCAAAMAPTAKERRTAPATLFSRRCGAMSPSISARAWPPQAAAFIRNSMPMGVNTHGAWGEGDVLSDQDAVDVAEYFTHMPRPDFAGKEKDWPQGRSRRTRATDAIPVA